MLFALFPYASFPYPVLQVLKKGTQYVMAMYKMAVKRIPIHGSHEQKKTPLDPIKSTWFDPHLL